MLTISGHNSRVELNHRHRNLRIANNHNRGTTAHSVDVLQDWLS